MAILIILQLRGKVRAIDLAHEFEVSVRTIYRDIDELSAAGIPVYGDGGPGGGISLLDGFKTKLTGLEENEAKSLFMIGMPQQAKILGLGDGARNIANKLLLSMPNEKRENAQKIARKFYFDFSPWYSEQSQPVHIGEIAKALLSQQQIRFDYKSWKSAKQWVVAPLGLVMKSNEYYLVAETNKGRTVFKAENISNLEVLDIFIPDFDFKLEEFWRQHLEDFYESLFQNELELIIEFEDMDKLKLSHYLQIISVGDSSEPGFENPKLIRAKYDLENNLIKSVLGAGFPIVVKSPKNIVENIKACAMKIANLHS